MEFLLRILAGEYRCTQQYQHGDTERADTDLSRSRHYSAFRVLPWAYNLEQRSCTFHPLSFGSFVATLASGERIRAAGSRHGKGTPAGCYRPAFLPTPLPEHRAVDGPRHCFSGNRVYTLLVQEAKGPKILPMRCLRGQHETPPHHRFQSFSNGG